MGFRCSFAVSQSEPDVLLKALGMSVVETADEHPDSGRFCVRLIKTGWTVLFAFDMDLPGQVQDQVAALSKDGVQFLGVLSETTMAVTTSRYAKGAQDWAVDWRGTDGFVLTNLFANGNLPKRFDVLKAEAIKAQAADPEVDHLFDIPVKLIEEETGFRYDRWLEPSDVDAFREVG